MVMLCQVLFDQPWCFNFMEPLVLDIRVALSETPRILVETAETTADSDLDSPAKPIRTF